MKKIYLTLFVAVALISPLSASAVDTPNTYVPLAPLPCINGGTVNCGTNGAPVNSVDFQTYVQYTVNLFIALAAVAAVFMMVWGGFEYMTTSAVSGKSEGLKKVYNALGGLALVLCSFLIAKTINPAFVQVPTGLVPNLGLSKEDTSSAWMDALNNSLSVAGYDANNATTRQQIADANAQLGQLASDASDLANSIYEATGEKDTAKACSDAAVSLAYESSTNDNAPVDLYGSTGSNDGTPPVNIMCANWQSNQAQQATVKSGVVYNIASQTMDNLVGYQCSPTGDPQACAAQSAKVAGVYANLSGQLQPDQMQQLQSRGLYDQAIANMNAQAATFYQKGSASSLAFLTRPGEVSGNTLISSNYPTDYNNTLSGINSAADSYIKSPGADPALVAQLKTQQQKTTTLVQNMTYHIPTSQ